MIDLVMFGELNSLTDFSEKSPPKVSGETTSIVKEYFFQFLEDVFIFRC